MNSDARHILANRYILFSCEGTAEGVVVQALYDNDLLVVPRDRVVKDALMVDRPYTRKRKALDIANQYFSMDYNVDGAEGLAVARIVDSRAPKFEFPKRKSNGTEVLSFFTRPEIEMLIIHAEGAFSDWLKASRRNRQLKPSDFCKQYLGMACVKEARFLKSYWSDASKLVRAIQLHAGKCQKEADDLLLADLLK